MSAREWSRKRLALVLAVVLTLVPIGYAAAKAARGPVEMSFACAKKSNGKLRYVEAADDCRKKERLISFEDAEPLIACARMGGSGRVYVYAMASRSKCEYRKRRPSFVLVLPDTTRHWFCANKRSGNLRSTRLVPSAPGRARVFTRDCKRNELRVFVEKRERPPVNRPPSAVADAGSTNEDTATTIAVLANDSDPDGDALSVTGVDTTGTAGAVTIGAGGVLRYDPAGRLDGLRAGEQRIDRFSYAVSDGHGGTASANVSVTVTGVNDAAVVTTSAGSAGYTENGAPVVVDGGATVADSDDATLEGATVEILSDQPADRLLFADQNGITGSYAAGVLTLTGSASVADYQTALRSVRYDHTGDDPAASKTVEFRANDGDGLGLASTRSVAVTAVNDAPSITTSAGAIGYTEGDPATAIDPGLVLTDPDSAQIAFATVQITGNHASAEDVLALPAQPGITGAYDSATGTLTLTGADTVANYQAALRAVTYRNTSSNPSTLQRTVTFVARDASSASAPATRNVNVSPTDNAPDVDNSAGALAYTENDPATAIDTTIAITDPDSANLTGATVQITGNYANGQDVLALPAQPVVTASFDPATGRLTLSGTDTVAAYESALEAVTYVNTSDDPSTAPRTVTYTARDAGGFGTPDTHGITVTAVDDPPTAVNDSPTVVEDSGANAIDVLANDTDVDAGPKSIGSVTQPANGTVVITGGGTGLTYQPNSNYCNNPPGTTPDTFTYTLSPGGSTATVSVTVTCADDPPTAVNDSATVGEDSGASAIDVLANDTDTDGGPKTVASVTQPANGTVAITGGGSSLTYTPNGNYCNTQPGGTPDTFTYTLNGGSTATVSVTVTCTDDSPIAVNDAAMVVEDSGATAIDVLANDTDADGGTKVVASATDPANGTVVLTGGSPGAHTGLTYQPDPNYCNDPPGTSPDTFTYSLNGGSTATVSVTVTCAPDNPVVDNSAGTTSYTENAAATVIDAAVTVTDPDAGTTITGAKVQITGGYAGAEDILALAGSHPGIAASFSGDTLTLTGPASVAAYQAALRDVTYRNGSDAPSTAARTVTFTATDDTSRSGSDTKGITVVAVDDPPVAVNDSATVLEDSAANAIDVLANDTDVDAGPKSIGSVTQPANGTVVITGGGTGLTYQPNPNYCNEPPGTTPDTFNYTLNGGSSATVSMTVTCVNDAPVADDETFNGNDSAHGNTTLQVDDPSDDKAAPTHPHTEITGDILAGDTDVDGPGPLTVTPGTFATNDGGSVTIESDGDFTFLPAASTSCTDTSDFFDYTVSDQNPAGPGPAPGTDTGRVTIAIAGCVWYVSNNAAGNSGTSSQPFDTLAQAETASGDNHTVFVFDGDNTPNGLGGDGYAMNAGERLIGEHEGLVVDPDGGGGLTPDTLFPANAGAHPTLTATSADVIDLDDGNEIRGLNVDPQNAGGIAGDRGRHRRRHDRRRQRRRHLRRQRHAGRPRAQRHDRDVQHHQPLGEHERGRRAAHQRGHDRLRASARRSRAAACRASSASGTNMGTSTFDAITVSGSTNGGVSMTNTTGTTVFGDGNGVDLALTTTSGTTPAFGLANAGTISVGSAGVDNVSATGGPAIDVTGTTGRDARVRRRRLDQQRERRHQPRRPRHRNVHRRRAARSPDAAGIAFDLDGGSGNVSYPGDLLNGSGQTAEITGRGGGAVTLSGPIADGVDAGGGISLSGNTAGSTTFSNASKVLNTTTSAAVSFTGSNGHTLTLSGGGLDVDTTSGAGISAADSGTLTVGGTRQLGHHHQWRHRRQRQRHRPSAAATTFQSHLRERRGQRHRASTTRARAAA